MSPNASNPHAVVHSNPKYWLDLFRNGGTFLSLLYCRWWCRLAEPTCQVHEAKLQPPTGAFLGLSRLSLIRLPELHWMLWEEPTTNRPRHSTIEPHLLAALIIFYLSLQTQIGGWLAAFHASGNARNSMQQKVAYWTHGRATNLPHDHYWVGMSNRRKTTKYSYVYFF